MATNTKVKMSFLENYRIAPSHLNTLGQIPISLISAILKGMYDGYGIFGSKDGNEFKVTANGDQLSINSGVIRTNNKENFIISETSVTISPTGMSDGTTYHVFVAYRTSTASPMQVNPTTGDTRDTLIISVIDNTSIITDTYDSTPQYSFYLVPDGSETDFESDPDQYIKLAKVSYSTSTGFSVTEDSRRFVYPKILWTDTATDGSLTRLSFSPSASVSNFTHLLNFLSCKGSSSRTTNNPFGLAMSDIGGRRDVWQYMVKSGIQTPGDDIFTSLQPSREAGVHDYIKLGVMRSDDYIVVAGVNSTPGANPADNGERYQADDENYIYISRPTGGTKTFQIWMLCAVYDESLGVRFRWVGGTASSPSFDEPLMEDDSLDNFQGYVAKSSTDATTQGVDGTLLTTVEEFIQHTDFVPITLIAVNAALSQIGVIYERIEIHPTGMRFSDDGNPGDIRQFHYLNLGNIRIEREQTTSEGAKNDYFKNKYRRSLKEIIEDHIDYTYVGTSYVHNSNKIKFNYSYASVSYDVESVIRKHIQRDDSSWTDVGSGTYLHTADRIKKITNTYSGIEDLNTTIDKHTQLDGDGLSSSEKSDITSGTYFHTADKIRRKDGFYFISDSTQEKDVDGALNAIVSQIQNWSVPSDCTVECRLAATNDDSVTNFINAIIQLNSISGNVAVLKLIPHESNNQLNLSNVSQTISFSGTLYIINNGVEVTANAGTPAEIIIKAEKTYIVNGIYNCYVQFKPDTTEVSRYIYFVNLSNSDISVMKNGTEYFYEIWDINHSGGALMIEGSTDDSAFDLDRPNVIVANSVIAEVKTSVSGAYYIGDLRILNSEITYDFSLTPRRYFTISSSKIDAMSAPAKYAQECYISSSYLNINSDVGGVSNLQAKRMVVSDSTIKYSKHTNQLFNAQSLSISGSHIESTDDSTTSLFLSKGLSLDSGDSNEPIVGFFSYNNVKIIIAGISTQFFYLASSGDKVTFMGNIISTSRQFDAGTSNIKPATLSDLNFGV